VSDSATVTRTAPAGRLRSAYARRRVARSAPAVVSWVVVLLFVLIALIGPWVVHDDPTRQTSDALLPLGSAGHLFGTDDLGRDELSRLVHGARPLLLVAFLATALASALGVTIGLIAGYAGGKLEWLLMRLMDLALAFPAMLLIILVVSAWQPGVPSLVVGIGLALAPGIARLTRALAAREAGRDYVLAARLGGTRGPRILVQELLPNIAGPLLAQIVMTLSVAAGFAAGLSYLGLGIQPPTPDWGYMVQASQEFLYTAPRLVVMPAAATLIFVVACNFVGDDLRDALDPRSKP
jgi:ABC-type dipeptide/oligopeptide/nickel transport system permease subunit